MLVVMSQIYEEMQDAIDDHFRRSLLYSSTQHKDNFILYQFYVTDWCSKWLAKFSVIHADN